MLLWKFLFPLLYRDYQDRGQAGFNLCPYFPSPSDVWTTVSHTWSLRQVGFEPVCLLHWDTPLCTEIKIPTFWATWMVACKNHLCCKNYVRLVTVWLRSFVGRRHRTVATIYEEKIYTNWNRALPSARRRGAGWGGAAQWCCAPSSVAGTTPSRAPGRAQPRPAPPRPFPRGVETKGARRAVRSLGERGGEFRRSGALGSLGLCWRGHGVGLATRTQEVGGPRVSRPSGEGRRLRAQRRPVRRRAASPGLWSPKRGAAGRGRAPSAVLRDGAEAWAVGARGRREWSLGGVRRLCHLWACSRRFLARPVWWCREEGSAVTAPQLEPGFRGWGGPRTADLTSWPRAGRAVTIGGGGPARSRGSCPAGRSLPSQVLAAAAVGSSARAGRAAGRWEPEGPHPSLGLRFGPAARRSLFPRWRGGAVSAWGAAGPLPGRWSRCLASSLPPFLSRRRWNDVTQENAEPGRKGRLWRPSTSVGFWTGCVLFSGDESSFRAEAWERLVFETGVFQVIEVQKKIKFWFTFVWLVRYSIFLCVAKMMYAIIQ